MQYSNRIQYRKENLEDFGPVKGTLPAFPIALKERMDRHIPVFEAKKIFIPNTVKILLEL